MTRVARNADDFYPTPAPVVAAHLDLVASLGISPCMRILEPSAGDGAYVRELRRLAPAASIVAVEPDELRSYTCKARGADVFRGTFEDYARPATFTARERFDLIVGNPPYSHAEKHVRLGLEMLASGGVLSFLLRLGFLESKARRALFKAHPPARVDVLSERPSFSWTIQCGDKHGAGCGHKWSVLPGADYLACPDCGGFRLRVTRTDATAYAIFTWREGHTGPTVLGHL